MPEGNELAQRPGVGNETVECVSLRKLQYVRRRSCVRSANALVLERLCRPPQLGSFIEPATGAAIAGEPMTGARLTARRYRKQRALDVLGRLIPIVARR
jgi:hypothetical protein